MSSGQRPVQAGQPGSAGSAATQLDFSQVRCPTYTYTNYVCVVNCTIPIRIPHAYVSTSYSILKFALLYICNNNLAKYLYKEDVPSQFFLARLTATTDTNDQFPLLFFNQAMTDFRVMFPDMDAEVIEAVLRANNGAVDATIDNLLAMTGMVRNIFPLCLCN